MILYIYILYTIQMARQEFIDLYNVLGIHNCEGPEQYNN